MKSRLLCFTLASVIAINASADIRGSRAESIGDQELSQSKNELAIIQHDLELLDQALEQAEIAIRERQKSNQSGGIFSLSNAAAGLGIVTLGLAISAARGNSRFVRLLNAAAIGGAALYTGISSALGLVYEFQKKGGSTVEADNALIKARQEILATRAGTTDHESMNALMELDQSLESIQNSLKTFYRQENSTHSLYLASLVSQTAGTAIALSLARGIGQNQSLRPAAMFLTPLLMASSNLASVLNSLSPSQTENILLEIAETRKTLAEISKRF